MTTTYKISSLIELFEKYDTRRWIYHVDANDTKHYVGSWEEIKEQQHIYEFISGDWTIYYYYDHLWFHFIIHNDYINSEESVEIDRETESTAHYGHLLKSWFDNEKQEETEDSQDMDDVDPEDYDESVGFVTSGRGDIGLELRMLKLEDGKVAAILFATNEFLSEVNEYLDD